jgi:hypothetical protein
MANSQTPLGYREWDKYTEPSTSNQILSHNLTGSPVEPRTELRSALVATVTSTLARQISQSCGNTGLPSIH